MNYLNTKLCDLQFSNGQFIPLNKSIKLNKIGIFYVKDLNDYPQSIIESFISEDFVKELINNGVTFRQRKENETSIDKLFSTRVFNVLNNHGIQTLEDIILLGPDKLQALYAMGDVSMKEVQSVIKKYFGSEFGQDDTQNVTNEKDDLTFLNGLYKNIMSYGLATLNDLPDKFFTPNSKSMELIAEAVAQALKTMANTFINNSNNSNTYPKIKLTIDELKTEFMNIVDKKRSSLEVKTKESFTNEINGLIDGIKKYHHKKFKSGEEPKHSHNPFNSDDFIL